MDNNPIKERDRQERLRIALRKGKESLGLFRDIIDEINDLIDGVDDDDDDD